MVRPRFAKLRQSQQQAILGAALGEFAAHGFHDASLNRVIDAAGISKGSMYYIEEALDAGQRIGAVRTDLPAGLLIAVVVGMGQAMDTWLVTRDPDAEALPPLVHALLDMIRGALRP